MNKVFVYGTLKEGFGNHKRLLSTSTKLGDFTTTGEYTMYSLGGFPGVVLRGDTAIHGEVYQVTNEVFKSLDILEGHPDFYQRKKIATTYGRAWMYYLTDRHEKYLSNKQIVPDGKW